MRFSDGDDSSDDCSTPRFATDELPTGATTAFDTTAFSISFGQFDTYDFIEDSSSSQPLPTPVSAPPTRSPGPTPPLVPPSPMPRYVRCRIAVARWAPLVLPVGLLTTFIILLVSDLTQADTSANSASADGIGTPTIITDWNACELNSVAADASNLTAQCTLIALPLCHEDVCSDPDNHTINVFVKRIEASEASDEISTAVWYIPDRPDSQTSAEADNQMALLFEQLNATTSVYRMDMRGTGQSSPLTCSVDLASAVFGNNQELTLDDVQQCSQDIRAMYGDRMAAFSLTSSAYDLKDVIETYQTESASNVGEAMSVIVYALGYGTLVAQRMMQLETAGVVGYVLDSPVATANSQSIWSESESDAAFGEVGDEFLLWCANDSDCAARFPNTSLTNVSATLEATFVRLDAENGSSVCSELLQNTTSTASVSGSSSGSGVTAIPSSYTLREHLAVLMENATLRPLIPIMIFRFSRCGSQDINVLTRLTETLASTVEQRDNELELVFAIQAFSELWESPSPNETELVERFTTAKISDGRVYGKLKAYCLFTGDSTSACEGEAMAGSLLAFERDGFGSSSVSVPANASVLILTGDMDGKAPTKFANALNNAIVAEGGKQLIVVANGTHNIAETAVLADGSSCGRQVVASFITSDGDLASVDASCIDELPTASLAVSTALSSLLLNVTDAYDGEAVPDTSKSASAEAQDESSQASSLADAGSSSLGAEVDDLQASRDRYRVALIVVGSLCAVSAVLAVAYVAFRRHRKRELAKEEALLRRMRGSEDDDFELLRGLYLSSFSYRTDPSAS